MTDKEYRLQKKRVQKFIHKWLRPIGLGWWQVDMEWSRERAEDAPNEAAKTVWQWQYRTAWITWRLPEIQTLSDEKLEGVVVHEFAHILTGAMVQNAPDENDQLKEYGTECVARALIWAREAGKKDKNGQKENGISVVAERPSS